MTLLEPLTFAKPLIPVLPSKATKTDLFVFPTIVLPIVHTILFPWLLQVFIWLELSGPEPRALGI